jgi:uncharacterized protein YecE (DUF72 family)
MVKERAMNREAARIFVGVGGWTYEAWRGVFYPPDLPRKRELEFASRKLTSIEINGTFYRTQSKASFAKWREETPEDFVFSVKAPRFAVSRRTPEEARDSITRFFASGVMALGDRLGPILWQFPPTRKFDVEFFDAFLALLPKEIDGRVIRHAIEVRHESFVCAAFVEQARRHGVAIVLAGDSKYPLIADVTADFIYARIMGTSEKHALGYSPKMLAQWAARAKRWAQGEAPDDLRLLTKAAGGAPRDVFLYVISGFKERDPAAAMALIERL